MENRRLSLLYNLQNLYNSSDVGSVDYQLSRYLIDNYQQIGNLNIFDVAEENHVSRATVRRFCQHLGYDNFKELKKHFSEFDEGFESYKTFYCKDDFLFKLREQLKLMFTELEDRLSNRELTQIVNNIHHSDEVIIVASSTIANSIRVFQQTMAIFGKRISIVASQNKLSQFSGELDSNCLILVFSISGALAETLQDDLFSSGATTFLFTNSRNPLFNVTFDRVYHLTSMDNQNNKDIIYYTYGITYVLDSIICEYSQLL
ncbi:MurR/RpiR family transcriptional regulator [Streptococcus devriesei]|uniref:MurR/RpiR family transcriptional regulator n=1 Tax=Streptococcus devriesei TaxID=231233 RepID=UPI0004050314|nr:MurR/RpiR family transcriptional regulator [Streptococcus devriesei]